MPREKTKKDSVATLVESAGIVFLGVIVGKLLNYGYRAMTARGLGIADYGTLNIGLSIFGFLGFIALFGLNQGAERYVSYYIKNKQKVNAVISTVLRLALPVSLAVSVLMILSARTLAVGVFHNEQLTAVIVLFSIATIAQVFTEIGTSLMRALGIIKYQVYIKNIIEPVSKIAITGMLFITGIKLMGATIAILASLTISMVLSYRVLSKKGMKLGSILKSKDKSIFFEVLRFSWPLLITAVVFNVMKWTDTIMLGIWKSEIEVGIYNAAAPTAEVLTIFMMCFSSLFIPTMSRLFARREEEAMRSVYCTVTRWVFFLTLPVYGILLIFPKEIIGLLFGGEYIAAVIPLMILSTGSFILAVTSMSTDILNVLSKTKTKMMVRTGGAVLNVLLNLILIPRWGMIGAAIGTAISLVVYNLAGLYLTYHYLNVQPFSWRYAKPLVAVGIIGALTYLVRSGATINGSVELLVLAPIFLAMYGGIVLVLRFFTKDDVDALKAIEAKMGLRRQILSKFVGRFIQE